MGVPSRTAPTPLPAPTIDLAADRAIPPPPLRVPAVTPTSLPPLTGTPIVPPMPRLSLDETPLTDLATSVPHSLGVGDGAAAQDVLCPPTVEAAPAFAPAEQPASDQFAPEPAATPTTQIPVVESIPGPSPSEPLGAPAAMVLPTLPSVAAAPSAAASHQPSQIGLSKATALPDPFDTGKTAPPKTQRRFGRSIVRTLFAATLAGALGAGAHVGYDWWEARDVPVAGIGNGDGTELASWPQVDPPAIRYTDSVTVFRTAESVRTLTAHREIASGRTQASITATDAAGNSLADLEVDYRGAESFIRPAPESQWAPTSSEDALAQIGDIWTADVFTVSELFPAAMLPFTTVLESVERVLPVRPLVPAVDPGAVPETPMATSTDPTSMVWQYRVIIDVDSFRANETAAYQEWSRRLGRNAVPRIEAWIDATGVVRQLSVEADGTVVTHTLVGGAADSVRFDTNPLLVDEPPVPAADGVVAATPAQSTEAGG